jgi:hypothetical protein
MSIINFKKGDKVRLKKDRKDEIRPEALNDILIHGSYGIFTIDKIIEGGHKYIAKEFANPWKWKRYYLELVEVFPFVGPLPEPINDRFEILDL